MQSRKLISLTLILSLILPGTLPLHAQAKSKSATPQKKSAKKSRPSARARAAERQRVLAEAARIKRATQAFVASTELKPMARQLMETHSDAAYKGVERYAKEHANEDAGALAWLALGAARLTDNKPDYPKAIAALKEARLRAAILSDYVDYLLATAYRAMDQPKDVVLVLDGFGKKNPGSVWARDAAAMQATALIQAGAYEDAVAVIEAQRVPARSDLELIIGKGYQGLGQNAKAIEAFRNVYFNMPLSGLDAEAGPRLDSLNDAGTPELRKTRADLLLKGGSYAAAIKEYKALIEANDKPDLSLRVSLAEALQKSKKDSEAQTVLVSMDLSGAEPESKARRLYLLAEIARSANDDAAQQSYLNELGALAPGSPWLQETLMSMGNKFLLRKDYAQASPYYDQVAQRFPDGKGATAHWKVAWFSYRAGQWDTAKRLFEQQIARFPSSQEAANALYWRGRLAEQDQQLTKARAYYNKITSRFRNYYYAGLAQERLEAIGDGPDQPEALLQAIPQTASPPVYPASAEGVTHIRLQKARLLSNAGLSDYAIKELQTAAFDPNNKWALTELARMQEEAGRHAQALQTLKRAIPSYFATDLAAFPRPILEGLFPRAYWPVLERQAQENALDPYLVASLIRQESEFNPQAVSRANAYGLMQLLPSVGRQVAHRIKLKPYSTASLLDPNANLRLGTRYFREMLDENGGQVEYALAAYNAGPDRVTDWLAAGPYRDIPEFVESIPFTETREYVQAIMRNVRVYKQLYGDKVARAANQAQ
ncbi:MAG: transglycosylase SLT domain-containing protein [Acidobacteriales bacterium]|nr:transglycosylase SLT domain-containing protein [Terriglobales bacterium]